MMSKPIILQGVLVGDKGVGKTFAMDVAARVIAGLGETSKFNQLTDVRTLLHYSANSTLPLTIEDNESSNKVRELKSAIFLISLISQEEKLAVASFDQQQYVAQGRSYPVICTTIMATNQIFK